jgi:DNA invertase Pin-like site-specific DNA recombinase
MAKLKLYDLPHVGAPVPVAIYARKSKDERARKKMRRAGLEVSQSISHQVKECQKWCEANGRAPIAILKEDLTSGAAESRPRLDEVFALARARMIVEVVVLYFERFSRDEEMEIMAMVAELRRYGVALRVVTEPHLDPSDGTCVMRLSMAAMVARDR